MSPLATCEQPSHASRYQGCPNVLRHTVTGSMCHCSPKCSDSIPGGGLDLSIDEAIANAQHAIAREELDELIARDLAACSKDQRAIYTRTAITPEKWSQSPWGVEGGGFWVIAISGDKAVWYNDIEDGFNVSRFVTNGRIPDDEYWCNQYEVGLAVLYLVGDLDEGYRRGPPRPID